MLKKAVVVSAALLILAAFSTPPSRGDGGDSVGSTDEYWKRTKSFLTRKDAPLIKSVVAYDDLVREMEGKPAEAKN